MGPGSRGHARQAGEMGDASARLFPPAPSPGGLAPGGPAPRSRFGDGRRLAPGPRAWLQDKERLSWGVERARGCSLQILFRRRGLKTGIEGDAPEAFDVRASARQLGDLAVQTLGAIMQGAGSDAAKLGAAREVLDRAYGKARAVEEGDGEPVTVVIRRFSGDGKDV